MVVLTPTVEPKATPVDVALGAVLTGARSYAAIGQWAAELTGAQLADLGLSRPRAPDASTFRRVFARLDAAVLDALVGRSCGPVATMSPGGG